MSNTIAALLRPIKNTFVRKQRLKAAPFTQAELQRLQFIIRQNTIGMTEVEGQLSREASALWTLCDRNDPSTQPVYDSFCEVRKELSRVKTYLRNLESLQRSIKRQLRT